MNQYRKTYRTFRDNSLLHRVNAEFRDTESWMFLGFVVCVGICLGEVIIRFC